MEYYIGFDIGGTKCAVSLGEVNGTSLKILHREEVKTQDSPIVTLGLLAPFVLSWKEQYAVKKAGISCGGPLDSKRGIIVCPPNLAKGWHGFEIVKYIADEFGLYSKLENDANACAVAEWLFGAGQGTQNMIFMTFGTGLGAGLILDGKLYSGTNGNAGEIGHVRLANNGPVGFNKAGSAEGFCSGNGIKNLAIIRAKERGIILDGTISAKTVFEKARKGDEFFTSIVRESAEKFGHVISILIDLFNPEVIVAGGVFMRNYDLFMPLLTPVLERESIDQSRAVCSVLPAKIGENVGDFAAIAIAKTL
ncbi:MAG: ROK family protein [Clostridia bacterium]|nr:ROK family protein [Clostridia bacterium]